MTSTFDGPRGMYFEDFQVGQKILSAGRTVTEADVVGFAGLTGDFNQIHIDAEYARSGPFGQRVAHGMLGFSIGLGLATQTGIMDRTVMAFREISEWKFSLPIFFGDTIHAELEVLEAKALPRLGGGSVLIGVELKNQKGEVLQRGKWSALFLGRPKA